MDTKELRKRWQESKRLAESDNVMKALHREVGGNMSYWSFFFVKSQMKALQLDGNPYIDCKTFDGWKHAGFRVCKGQKSQIEGVVWKDFAPVDSDEVRLYPKPYHLFHKSQVKAL